MTFGNPVVGFDEQFYLLVGDRLWHGALPFVDIFDRKPIGLFLIYAATRAFGGDGFLQYKLAALAFVVATALLIYRVARRSAGPRAALMAAGVYILWLNFMEGEGGQSPVFYNLPMMAAAAIVVAATAHGGSPRRPGAVAMTLVGVAIQIKYSVVFEGVYVGCWLIAAAWAAGQRGTALAGSTVLWIGCALAPTALVFLVYESLGHADAFVFANFVSVFAQGRSDANGQIEGGAAMLGILAIPALLLWRGWNGRSRVPGDAPATAFLLGWLAASVAGIVLYWRFVTPQYAMPVLLPLTCLIAPVLDASRRRRTVGAILVLVGFVVGQIVLVENERRKGGARAAALVARAADPAGAGCIYVYDGYPGLYMLTHSCLPTRWAFPAHLSTLEEARSTALGVDPVAEVRRILAARPVAIVDDYPRFSGGNPVTHRLLQEALDAGYGLAACVRTGANRVRLVYRRKEERPAPPDGCPSDAALRSGV